MSDIQAGDEIDARWWPDSVRAVENTDQLNVTSTSYTAGTPECSTTFVAPLSGRVQCVVAAEMRNDDTAGNRIFVSFEIRVGSSAGSLFLAASTFRSVSTSGDTTASQFQTHGNMTLVEGLTPKTTYFIRAMHMVSGGTTNDIGHRRVCVIPVP